MAKDPIRMTDGFRKANIKAGQLTDEDANGEWQLPGEASGIDEEQFMQMLGRVSRRVSPPDEASSQT